MIMFLDLNIYELRWSRVSINYVFKMKVFEWDMKREIKLKLMFFSFLNYCGHYTIIIVNNIIFLNGILHEVVMQRGWIKREGNFMRNI